MSKRTLLWLLFSLGLPIVLASALTVTRLYFTSSAYTESLRVWLDPASVILHPGQSYELSVQGHFDSTKPLPFLSLDLASPLLTDPVILSRTSLPSGDFTLGSITITATTPGTFSLSLADATIVSSLDPSHISTGSVEIIVR